MKVIVSAFLLLATGLASGHARAEGTGGEVAHVRTALPGGRSFSMFVVQAPADPFDYYLKIGGVAGESRNDDSSVRAKALTDDAALGMAAAPAVLAVALGTATPDYASMAAGVVLGVPLEFGAAQSPARPLPAPDAQRVAQSVAALAGAVGGEQTAALTARLAGVLGLPAGCTAEPVCAGLHVRQGFLFDPFVSKIPMLTVSVSDAEGLAVAGAQITLCAQTASGAFNPLAEAESGPDGVALFPISEASLIVGWRVVAGTESCSYGTLEPCPSAGE